MGRRIIIRRKNKVALELEQVWMTTFELNYSGNGRIGRLH